MLATTATMAALKVPTRYSPKMGLSWVVWPGCWLLMAAITKINTRIGATAFRAEMNKVPRTSTRAAASGQTRAKMVPATRLITICVTMLVRCSQPSKGR